MDLFNTKYINHLTREIELKNARINALELRLSELLDAKMFNRIPERLVRKVGVSENTASENLYFSTEKDEKSTPNYETSVPSDALSAAEAEAWELSRPASNMDKNTA